MYYINRMKPVLLQSLTTGPLDKRLSIYH